MLKPIAIALAAKTPIYLPLLLADFHDYYNLVEHPYQVVLRYPEPTVHDHDGWVHDKIITDDYSAKDPPVLFGVCDPYCVFCPKKSRLIGALVTKTAFWGFNTKTKMDHLADVSNFRRIIAYPEGMTAHILYKLSRSEGLALAPTWDVAYVEALVGEEFPALSNDHAETLAISPNPFKGLRLCREDNTNQFQMKYSYASHPRYGNAFITGLIARPDVIEGTNIIVTTKGRDIALAIVSAIQLALNQIHKDPEAAVSPLLDRLGEQDTESLRKISLSTIHTMLASSIFPQDLRISREHVASNLMFHSGFGESDTKLEKAVDEVMMRDVDNSIATQAWAKYVHLRVSDRSTERRLGGIASTIAWLGPLCYVAAHSVWSTTSLIALVAFEVLGFLVSIFIAHPKSFTDDPGWTKPMQWLVPLFLTSLLTIIVLPSEVHSHLRILGWFQAILLGTPFLLFLVRKPVTKQIERLNLQ